MPQASNGAQPTGHVARLVDLLAAHPDGLTGAQVRSSSAFSGVPAPRLAALIGTALALGHVTETTGRLHAVNAAASAAEPADAEPLTTALRAVVLDVESIVKTTSKEPFTEKRIYQIGAVRAGTASAWIGAEPAFTRWLELPDDTWVILSEGAWAEQRASAIAPADALMAAGLLRLRRRPGHLQRHRSRLSAAQREFRPRGAAAGGRKVRRRLLPGPGAVAPD